MCLCVFRILCPVLMRCSLLLLSSVSTCSSACQLKQTMWTQRKPFRSRSPRLTGQTELYFFFFFFSLIPLILLCFFHSMFFSPGSAPALQTPYQCGATGKNSGDAVSHHWPHVTVGSDKRRVEAPGLPCPEGGLGCSNQQHRPLLAR